MEDAKTITGKVKIRTEALQSFFKVMDDDWATWNVERSSYDGTLDTKTKRHSSDIDIISNSLRLFSDDEQSILSSSERQIRVRMAEETGEDKREEEGKLERLLIFGFEKADERLVNLVLPPLKEFTIWNAGMRGGAAGRFLVLKKGDKVIFDFLPYDYRWLVYQVGGEGLLWTNYTDSFTPEELEDKYGKTVKEKPWYKVWETSKKSYDVLDYWQDMGKGKSPNTRKIANAIICEEEFIKPPTTYELPSMPIVIVPVATKPPVRDSNNQVVGRGEGIFAPLRKINGIRNRFMSIEANHANLMANQALINYKGDNGRPIESTVNIPGGVLELTMGENKLEPSPMKELSPTVIGISDWLNGQIERGILPKVDIGKPPPSGTLYNLVQESGNRVLNPQIQCLDNFYAGACRLVEEQLRVGGVGRVGRKPSQKIRKVNVQMEYKGQYYEHEVTKIDLEKPHIIKVQHTARTPYQQMDTWAIADMAKRQGLPERWINENILKLQDPKMIEDWSAMEMADHSPKLAMLKAIEAYLKYGQEPKAMETLQEMYNMEMEEANAGMGEPTSVATGTGVEAEGAVSL